MKALFFITLILTMSTNQMAAQKEITLEGIWTRGEFNSKLVPGFNFLKDGGHYTLLNNNKILSYDITSGDFTETIFDPTDLAESMPFSGRISSYTFSDDENLLLLATDQESIYRRSYYANYLIFNREDKSIAPLFEKGKQMNALFSPDGQKVGFVFDNNLYYKDLRKNQIVQISEDGRKNEIINGAADWVYEEEFAITRTFEWSSDSRHLAWIRFDEREVPEFTMTNYEGGLYPEYETFKYPKVGERNSVVAVNIYDSETGETHSADIMTTNTDLYIPRIKWMPKENKLIIFVLNRHQNDLKLIAADPETGRSELLMQETNPYYIDIHDNLTFLSDGEQFLWTSDTDGYNQIYLHHLNGDKVKVTRGDYDVTDMYGYDPVRNRIYFQAAINSPLEREVYSIRPDGSDLQKVAGTKGWNAAGFSTTFDYLILNHSSSATPPVFTVCKNDGSPVRVLEDNAALVKRIEAYNFRPREFFTFQNREGVSLNGYMIRPPEFDPKKEYPVFMFLYGGPGSQQVVNRWGAGYEPWFQMLAQKGYIVACVDNRGTGARGAEFKKSIYLNLGKQETADQIDAARYLGDLDYVDKNRIGVFGWSYGGYMSTNLILHGNEVFRLAIAVAPVTNWRWYDTIYTERYMRTESENEKGYYNFSPVYFAPKLKGRYLLVHGISDDNVHFQHSAEMANALIKAGKKFEAMYYPNNNHGISEQGARLHLFTLMTDFIMNNL